MLAMAGARSYNPSVLVGNWIEEICLEEVSGFFPSFFPCNFS